MSLPTVAVCFDPRSNGITPLRLILALTVLIMHIWPIAGLGPDPAQMIANGRLDGGGTLAVICFFGLSGFLLADSRARGGRLNFFWRRAVRILPGYWLCILATAVVVGPWYVEVAWLPNFGVGEVDWAGFEQNPLLKVNASLWTLPFELVCYAVVGILPARHLRGLAIGGGATFAWLMAAGAPGSGCALVVAFCAGMAMSLWRDSLPLDGRFAAVAISAVVATIGPGVGLLVAAIAVPYVALWVATKPWPRCDTDISYGVYVYGFPVTQMLVAAGVDAAGPVGLTAGAVLITCSIATVSWLLVEQPAMRIARFIGRPAARWPATRAA